MCEGGGAVSVGVCSPHLGAARPLHTAGVGLHRLQQPAQQVRENVLTDTMHQ